MPELRCAPALDNSEILCFISNTDFRAPNIAPHHGGSAWKSPEKS